MENNNSTNTPAQTPVYTPPSVSGMFKSALGINTKPSTVSTSPQQNAVKPENEIIKPSEVLLEWEAPERFYKKRSRDFYRKIGVIIIFCILLLVLIKEFLLVVLLVVLFFAVYAFSTIPPNKVRHQITTNGVNYASGQLYAWNLLTNFYIKKHEGVNVLYVGTKSIVPGRLILILSDEVKESDVISVVNQYISILEKPEDEPFDKISAAFSKRLKI